MDSSPLPPGMTRMFVTIMMWISIAVTEFGIAIYGAVSKRDITLPLMIPLIIAFLGTLAIWVIPEYLASRSAPESTHADSSKTKRQGVDKLSLLLELMDDEERAAFKKRLERQVLEEANVGEDGELPDEGNTLESLFYEEGKRAQTSE